jgi:hypothetical protein
VAAAERICIKVDTRSGVVGHLGFEDPADRS